MMGRPLSRAIKAAVSRVPVSCAVPRPSEPMARENAITSLSVMQSVTMGVPSKSSCTFPTSPETCALKPQPPAAIPSTRSRHISSSCSSVTR